MTDRTEHELRRLFADLRMADQANARDLEDVLSGRRPRPVTRSRAYPVVAAAAALVAFGFCLKGALSQPSDIQTASVTEWSPPTDVLLGASRPTLFGPMAPLGSSVLDPLLR